MKQTLAGIVIALATVASACGGDTPMAPTPPPPPPPASLIASGTLTFSTCFPQTPTVSTCFFSGIATNNGSGCATNVRGSTVTMDTNHNQIGSVQWTYSLTVRAGERITYSGSGLNAPVGGGTYDTQITWDNLRCQ